MQTFTSLVKKYMRRIRASAKDVADELGLSRQTVLNWVNGVSMPSNCDKIIEFAIFLRLTPQETESFLQAAGCEKLASDATLKFVNKLFNQLSVMTPYSFLLLLTQANCTIFPLREVLLNQAKQHYSPGQVLHIHPPFFTNTDTQHYFRAFGKQCGFEHVNDELSFEEALQARLQQVNPLFLLVSRFEQTAVLIRQQLAGILHHLSELYPQRLHVVLCGGERLAELKYGGDELALLKHAAIEHWPELDRAEVYALRNYRFKELYLDDELVEQFLTISGRQPQLLEECFKLRQQYPELALADYPKILSQNDYVWQLFIPFGKDNTAKQKICQWLQQEELGKAQPYILDDLLRQLYWKDLLVERGKRLYWRCEALRLAGQEILTH